MDPLSDELICSILSHVDAWTLFKSVQFVCKRLRRLAFENRLWYGFVESSSGHGKAMEKAFYNYWTEVDWHNEWKWYGLCVDWANTQA